MRWPAFILSTALFVAPSPAWSVVIHVYPDGSGDAPTIAAAYLMAIPGDDILLGPGTFFEHDIPNTAWFVDLRSDTDDPNTTVIDAQQLGRCLLNAIGTYTTVRGITFQNGTHPIEGGLVLANSGKFENCIFRNGSAPRGGAAAHTAFIASFSDCLFESNSATLSDGGAIWSYQRDYGQGVVALRCVFRSNSSSRHGGAIYTDVIPVAFGFFVSYSQFEENSAGADGGGFYSTGEGNKYDSGHIGQSQFLRNSASNGGAARLNYYENVFSCQFLENEAAENGGALLLYRSEPSGEDDHSNSYSLLAWNRAGNKGGAIFLEDGASQWRSSTFAFNEAPFGGHLNVDGGGFGLYEVILAFAASGGAAQGSGGVSGSCSDVYGNIGGDFVGPLEGKKGEWLSADPLFCDAPNGDFTLQEGSPCLQPPGCGSMGAFGQGCSPVSIDSKSWGSIKSLYR